MPALFLDLDGTIRRSKSGDFISGPDDIVLFPEVEAKLWEYKDAGYLIFGVSNQGGIAFGYKTSDSVNAEMAATFALFTRNPFVEAVSCPYHPDGSISPWNRESMSRKPNTGLLALLENRAFFQGILLDYAASLFVGDRDEDEQCAAKAGIAFQWANAFFGRQE
jgi:D-glycero-D-manno-heptose 1,7-bisphosphate phosphatase